MLWVDVVVILTRECFKSDQATFRTRDSGPFERLFIWSGYKSKVADRKI